MASYTRLSSGVLLAAGAVCLNFVAASAQGQPAAKPAAKPSCVVSDAGERNAPATTGFPPSLDEARRKRIFVDLSKAVDQAKRDTAKEYPTRASSSLSVSAPTDGKGSRYSDAQRLTLRASEAKHVAGVTRAHSLGCEDARGVFREGQSKKWPAS